MVAPILSNPVLPQPVVSGKLGDGDDMVFIKKTSHDEYAVTINGDTAYYTADQLKALSDKGYFKLGGGNDSMVIDESVDVGILVNGGAGDDVIMGGSGNDSLWGSAGNDMISGRGGDDVLGGILGNLDTLEGGAGRDTLHVMAGKPDNKIGYVEGEDNTVVHDGEGTTGTTTAPAATPPTTAPATTAPATTAPATTAPAAAPVVSAGGTSVIGDNNTVIVNSAPGGTASTTNAAATATAKGIAKDTNFDLAGAMASGSSGLKQTSPGVYTGTAGGFNVTATQPGGAGTPMDIKLVPTSGVLAGTTINIKLSADGSKTVYVSGGNLTAEQTKSLNDLIDKGLLDGLDNAFTSVKKKKGGGSATTGAGAAAGGAGEGMSGSVDGSSSGAIDGGSGLDGTSGLDTNVSDGSDSWFMVLAVAMGTIMNKMAEKMIGLLNKIKAAGDDPPYALTAEFQATAQMLSFMQQAFMTALNSLGESIKTSVTAGGAAR
jgi:hypothetical protein